MSRHARYRHADARRARPNGQPDGPRPVVTESAGPAPAAAPQPEAAVSDVPGAAVSGAPEPGLQAVAAVLPMAAVLPPTASVPVAAGDGPPAPVSGCTPAQLRRFIKSRAYLPVHEIRRRFGIESADDDVTGFDVEFGRIYVGLPLREGRILGDLVRAGEVGYELQLDPVAPVVVGVYPMRPVTRQ